MRNLFPSEKPLLWVIFFSKSLLNGWNHVKKNVSKDSSYQIYFTEIGSWICNPLVNQENGCLLAR